MPKRVSIADARGNLSALIRSAEQGQPVELTRRGKLVAVLVSSQDYEKLTTGPPDLWAAIQKFRSEHDLSGLHVEEVFANVRDRAEDFMACELPRPAGRTTEQELT